MVGTPVGRVNEKDGRTVVGRTVGTPVGRVNEKDGLTLVGRTVGTPVGRVKEKLPVGLGMLGNGRLVASSSLSMISAVVGTGGREKVGRPVKLPVGLPVGRVKLKEPVGRGGRPVKLPVGRVWVPLGRVWVPVKVGIGSDREVGS